MKIFTCIFLFFSYQILFPQKKYNVLSLEAGYGFNIPLAPTNDISLSDYILPRHFDLGARYMFDEIFGLKMHYAHDRFQNKNNKNIGNSYNRLSLEAVYNFDNKLNLINNPNINLLFHTGIGIAYAYPEAIKRFKDGGEFTFGLAPYNTKDFERIGNIILGISTQYRYSDKVALVFDFSYIINTEQQYSYSGELLFIDRTKVRGSFFNVTLGIHFYLGKERRHADWYNSSRKY